MASESTIETFFHAVSKGDLDHVKAFLAESPELANARDDLGSAPLHDASLAGNTALVELLLAFKADPNAAGSLAVTPLHYAAGEGRAEVAALLLANGANVDATEQCEGQTPLHWAIKGIHEALVQLLLAGKANVNAADNNGSAPLHTAAGAGLYDIAELLLAHGANVNTKTKWEWTPLSLARARLERMLRNPKKKYQSETEGARRVIDLLGEHGADGWQKEFSQVVARKVSSKIDWGQNKELLIKGTQTVVSAFLAQAKTNDLCAIGYCFESANNSPQFNLCADLRTHRSDSPNMENPEFRWNCGEYKYPAGIGKIDELGEDWAKEVARLHELTLRETYAKKVYDGLIKISCEVLAELAVNGLFGDWRQIDFNVSEVNDDIGLVMKRDKAIRRMIKRRASKGDG